MFCTSLRKREEFKAVPSILLSHQQTKWTEKNIGTHDLELPLPRRIATEPTESLRLILLSQSDLEPNENGMARIERMYHHAGGRQVGVVFLLNEKKPKGNGTSTFMDLQISLLPNYEIPTIPLFSLSSLLQTIFGFQIQLANSKSSAGIPSQASPFSALLPFCSTNPPIPEHQRNIISETCRNIPELARAATTSDGQRAIHEVLSDARGVAEEAIGFWQEEFIVD